MDEASQIAALAAQTDQLEAALQEAYGMLELALEDQGWRRLTALADQEFSRAGLDLIVDACDLSSRKNPLIRRGLRVQRDYVFGQGITATAAHPDINAALQAWWLDPRNQASLTSHQAMQALDTRLSTEGNLFFALFTNPRTGRVRVRLLPLKEVLDIVTDPDDAQTPRYYLRSWTQVEEDGRTSSQRAAYPDWRYTPRARPAEVQGHRVLWDAPVYHVAVDKAGRWGTPEIYSGIDWGRAYSAFLEDWATFTRALSRYAAKLSTPGGAKGTQAARARLGSTLAAGAGQGETNPGAVAGSTLALGQGYSYDPVRIGGANVSADDGRRLLLMVAAAQGLPETFYGDASVGSLATAESLDRPTELAMLNRQQLWRDVLLDLTEHAIRAAATAAAGPLRPLVRSLRREYDPDDGTVTTTVVWRDAPAQDGGGAAPIDPSVTIAFPPVVETSAAARMTAISSGAAHLPAGQERTRLLARLVLEALGVAEIDSVLDALMADAAAAPPPPAPPRGAPDPSDPTDEETPPDGADDDDLAAEP